MYFPGLSLALANSVDTFTKEARSIDLCVSPPQKVSGLLQVGLLPRQVTECELLLTLDSCNRLSQIVNDGRQKLLAKFFNLSCQRGKAQRNRPIRGVVNQELGRNDVVRWRAIR